MEKNQRTNVLRGIWGVIASVISGTLLLSACANTTPQTQPTSTPSTFSNVPLVTKRAAKSKESIDGSFSAVIPPDWLMHPEGKFIFRAQARNPYGEVIPVLGVSLIQVDPLPTLDEALQSAMVTRQQQGVQVKRLPARTIGGVSALGFEMRYSKDDVPVLQYQYLCIHNNAVYVVTASASAHGKSSIDTFLKDFLASWAWNPAGPRPVKTATTPANSTSSSPSKSGKSPK